MANQQSGIHDTGPNDIGGTLRPPSPGDSVRTMTPRFTGSVDSSGSDSGNNEIENLRCYKVETKRKLSWKDVSALIINKMIGTGIFTGPPTILLYTGVR